MDNVVYTVASGKYCLVLGDDYGVYLMEDVGDNIWHIFYECKYLIEAFTKMREMMWISKDEFEYWYNILTF